LTFSNNIFKIVTNRYANKFSSFTSGQINIEDNGSEYLAAFEADNTRTFIVAATISNGEMELSYMYNQEDVENLKKNFDKAIAAANNKR